MKITFKRYNNQDIECANDNYPDDEPLIRLEKQFRSELEESTRNSELVIEIDHIYHPEVGIMIIHATTEVGNAEQIQRICFDNGGMTGFFQVSEDNYPVV